MKKRHQYFTLIASLPQLPRLNQAVRLPISREQLEKRMQMLEPEDREVVQKAEEYILWRRQPITRTDSEVISYLRHLQTLISQPALTEMIDFRFRQRTIMVAIRRKVRGMPVPSSDKPWGLEPWVQHIERYWDSPDFNLTYVFPWVVKVRKFIEAKDAISLGQFLMNQVWNQLDQITFEHEFGLEAVLAYLFKWDILQQWLSQNEEVAQTNFQILLEQTHLEYEPSFN